MIYTTFSLEKIIVKGSLWDAAKCAQRFRDHPGVVIFDESTYHPVDIDLSGTEKELEARVASHLEIESGPTRSGGRPKLGIISREVTLLPRHWDWLAEQPGGVSAALRRLVASARKDPAQRLRLEKTGLVEKAHRFFGAMAGDLAGFEEALRALYAGRPEALVTHTQSWPKDIAETAKRLAQEAWDHGVI